MKYSFLFLISHFKFPISMESPQTGPRSPSGKDASRQNAFKHGLRATDELFLRYLDDNERRVLLDMRSRLRAEYEPVTEQEKLLVDRIAVQHVRLFRLYRLEIIAQNKCLDDPLAPASVLPHLDRISNYDSRVERQLRILHNKLVSLYCQRYNSSLNQLSSKD